LVTPLEEQRLLQSLAVMAVVRLAVELAVEFNAVAGTAEPAVEFDAAAGTAGLADLQAGGACLRRARPAIGDASTVKTVVARRSKSEVKVCILGIETVYIS
jgi:hypothetical protein